MKKIVTLLCVIGFSLTTYAEMLLWQNGEFTIANLDSITFVTEPSVFVMPNTLNLSVGDAENLSAVLVPEPTSYYVPITWTSDNEEVATVSDGYVTALSYGTANIIVSAEGYAPDTCVVLVTNDAVLDDIFHLNSFGLFGQSPTMIEGTEQEITMASGDKYKCQLGYITMYAWDNNITYTRGTGFSGAGYFFMADVPVFWIIEGAYAGYYVGNSDGYYIESLPQDSVAPYTMHAGELVDLQKYGDFWKLALTGASLTDEQYALYTDAQTGAQIFYMDWENGDQSWYLGNMAEGQFLEDENGDVWYYLDVDWYDYVNENRLYGLLCNTDESGDVSSIVEPYDMRIIQKEYTNVSYEGKPAKRKAQAKAQYTVGGQIQNSTVAMKQVKQAVRAALKK